MSLIISNQNQTVIEYIKNAAIRSKNTAIVYQSHLLYFSKYTNETYHISLDELVSILTTTNTQQQPTIDVYNMLSNFVSYVTTNSTMTPITIQHLMSTVRNYLETFGVELSLRRYKLKVKTPRVIRSEKEALTKEDIRCTHSQKLRTYIHFLASTGCRATEALSIRLADINFDKDPVTVFIHGENTKTKVDRVIILTSETVEQLKLWIAYRHRTRRVHYYDKQTGLSINEQRTPTIDKQEYIFASKHDHAPR